MTPKSKTILLTVISAIVVAIYLFFDLRGSWDYALPRRIAKVTAMILTGGAIALSTTIFQTITNNRILTPSIMGLDSLYLLIQTLVVFLVGSTTLTMMNNHIHFLMTIGIMILFSGVLYKLMFQSGRNVYLLLLIGIIFGTLFQSLSSFMQILIDPNEFQIVQDKMFASFNNINTELLWIAGALILVVILYFLQLAKYLDVLSLGRDQAVNLGVDYDHVVKHFLVIVATLVSISTALVGPITFLGLLVVNVTYELMKTYRHRYLLVGSFLISIITLVGGQLMVEKVFSFSTPLSVIINFVGGIYFIYLLLKESRT